MRVSRIGALVAAAAAFIVEPAMAEHAGPEGGASLGGPVGGFWIVFVLGIVGCVAVSAGTILTAKYHLRRSQVRHPCALTVRIEPSAGSPVRLVDISRRGACLRMMLPPMPGAKVTLLWEDLALEATVAWSGEVFAGLRFRTALPERTMTRMIAASPQRTGRAAASDWVTPGLGA